MNSPVSSYKKEALVEPNAKNQYQIEKTDLPLHCPLDGMSLWNSHPRVFLPIEETGQAKCPYCGAVFILKDSSKK